MKKQSFIRLTPECVDDILAADEEVLVAFAQKHQREIDGLEILKICSLSPNFVNIFFFKFEV